MVPGLKPHDSNWSQLWALLHGALFCHLRPYSDCALQLQYFGLLLTPNTMSMSIYEHLSLLGNFSSDRNFRHRRFVRTCRKVKVVRPTHVRVVTHWTRRSSQTQWSLDGTNPELTIDTLDGTSHQVATFNFNFLIVASLLLYSQLNLKNILYSQLNSKICHTVK